MRLNCTYFLGQLVVYLTLTILVDYYRANTFRKADNAVPKTTFQQHEPNADVIEYEQNVKAASREEEAEFQIKAVDLHKSYSTGKRLHAVCGNTFGVGRGKILGLLGPNGAGKSSTFSVMAMQDRRSQGLAEVLGQSVDRIDLSE